MNILDIVNRTINYYEKNGLIRTLSKFLCSLKPITFKEVIMYHKQIKYSKVVLGDTFNMIVGSKKDIDDEYHDIWHTKEVCAGKIGQGRAYLIFSQRS